MDGSLHFSHTVALCQCLCLPDSRVNFNLFGELNIDASLEFENVRTRIGPNATINLNSGLVRFQFDERFGTLRFDDVDQNTTIVKVCNEQLWTGSVLLPKLRTDRSTDWLTDCLSLSLSCSCYCPSAKQGPSVSAEIDILDGFFLIRECEIVWTQFDILSNTLNSECVPQQGLPPSAPPPPPFFATFVPSPPPPFPPR